MTDKEFRIIYKINNIEFDRKVLKTFFIVFTIGTLFLIGGFTYIFYEMLYVGDRKMSSNIFQIVCFFFNLILMSFTFRKLYKNGIKLKDRIIKVKYEIQSYLIEKMGIK